MHTRVARCNGWVRPYTHRVVRLSRVIRATAWGVVAVGVAAPLVRRRIKAPPLVTQICRIRGARGPVRDRASLAHARRGGVRAADVGISGRVQDPARRRGRAGAARAHRLPDRHRPRAGSRRAADVCACSARSHASTRLTAQPSWRTLDRVLVWAHWAWFMVPHGSLAYILVRHPERFPRAAVMTYAVFDVGASVYWLAPTAPPWYAASVAGREDHGAEDVRRMMVEYGEQFWRDGWGPLYSVFGGNPLAAMPSLHFATSLMAALLLAQEGPLAGGLGADVCGDARVRAGVPGRALRGRSARGGGADGGGAPAGTARGAGVRALRPGDRGVGGDGARDELR